MGSFAAFKVVGKGSTEDQIVRPQTVQRPAENTDEKMFLVLGDSLARGTGSTDGLSIVERALKADGRVYNLSTEGLRMEGLLPFLNSDQVLMAIKEADDIFISIGGNDLRQVARGDFANRDQHFETALKQYLSQLDALVEQILSNNDKAKITFLGLYPLTSTLEDNQYLVKWNNETQLFLVRDDRLHFLPTYDLFQNQWEAFLSADGLHPNQMGYEAISNRWAENNK